MTHRLSVKYTITVFHKKVANATVCLWTKQSQKHQRTTDQRHFTKLTFFCVLFAQLPFFLMSANGTVSREIYRVNHQSSDIDLLSWNPRSSLQIIIFGQTIDANVKNTTLRILYRIHRVARRWNDICSFLRCPIERQLQIHKRLRLLFVLVVQRTPASAWDFTATERRR